MGGAGSGGKRTYIVEKDCARLSAPTPCWRGQVSAVQPDAGVPSVWRTALAPLVQRLEQWLVAGQVRQLALRHRDVLAAHVRLEVALRRQRERGQRPGAARSACAGNACLDGGPCMR